MSDEISGERLVAAWRANALWFSDLLSGMTRELSKTGDLGSHDQVLRAMAPHLTTAEICSLYRRLQQSYRPESEWKQEFLAIFSGVTDGDLPQPVVDEDEAQRIADELRAVTERQRRVTPAE
jgi:hypothetical protein